MPLASLAPLASAGHGIGDVRGALIGLAAVVGWFVFVLARPHARCWRCFGRKVVKPRRGKRKQKCRVCRGHGVSRLPGATMAHRFFWSVAGDRLTDRRREEIAAQLAARKDET
jgi:hypothetical protein